MSALASIFDFVLSFDKDGIFTVKFCGLRKEFIFAASYFDGDAMALILFPF